jgi:hypothetical protein
MSGYTKVEDKTVFDLLQLPSGSLILVYMKVGKAEKKKKPANSKITALSKTPKTPSLSSFNWATDESAWYEEDGGNFPHVVIACRSVPHRNQHHVFSPFCIPSLYSLRGTAHTHTHNNHNHTPHTTTTTTRHTPQPHTHTHTNAHTTTTHTHSCTHTHSRTYAHTHAHTQTRAYTALIQSFMYRIHIPADSRLCGIVLVYHRLLV